ncbi:hypothetical protein ATERTT37_004520 [Aspergillus terreus]
MTHVLEGLESLSRASQYPELQSASLVYPTPPDGAAGLGLNATATSDTFADDSDFGSGVLQRNGKAKSLEDTGAVPMEFGPSAGLTVGSGLYDTNEDDDLFGDMNERDFGTKGITDADFSFFDDPGFDHLGGDVPDSAQALSDMMELTEPNTQPTIVEAPPEAPVTEGPPVPEPDIPHVDHTDNPTGSHHGGSPVHDSPIRKQSPTEKNQTISPPLSPVEIKRILFPGTNGNVQPSTRKGRSQSYYNPIAFKEDISTWDQKYGASGKFGFTIQEPRALRYPSTSNGDIPTVGLPGRSRKVPMVDGVVLDVHDSSDAGQQNDLVSDSGSDSSDDGDNFLSEGDAPETVVSSLKRKRARSNSGNSLALSQAKSTNEGDKGTPAPKVDHSIFLGNFLSTSSDWSMAGYFSFQENQIFPVLARKDFQVQIAQLLVDQVTQSSLDHKLDGTCSISDLESETYSIQTFLDDNSFMSGIERLDLNGFVSLLDSDSVASPAPNGVSSRQLSQRKDALKGSLTKLPPPHLRVRRGKEYLEALPPTVLFWETFGLEPAHGPKDVSAYCIHPRIASNSADAFLDRLGSVYSSCNLGKHTRGDRCDAFDRGLGVWDISSDEVADYSSAMQSLKSLCANLAALVDICSAFWSLFQTYIAAADKQHTLQLDELVLQIVPVDFIMSTDSFVVPPQTQYLNLALEVYSRCPPKDQQTSLVNCAPPVLITEPLPKSINFRLASEKTSPLQEGKCLHVASSRSQDQRWISVAWSDNTGSLQRTMSYNIRFRNATASRTLQDVRGEIWGATKDIMERIQARWRIVLVNSDPVDQDEVDYSALEAESESLLTDVTDETWAVTLSHRLNSSPHLMDYRPALASGYLLRRKGATDGDGVYTLTLNLIYTQRHSSSYETVLREILQMYRDLATLARARGTRTVQRSAMPWHIATAVRAQEALSYVM